jgi:hypothetical protein
LDKGGACKQDNLFKKSKCKVKKIKGGNMKLKKVLLIMILIVVMSGLICAQATSSKIMGKVTDQEGTALPGVTITATNPKMVGSTVAITDENGVFRLFSLQPGNFTVKFELEGFGIIIRKNIALTVEQTLALNVKLSLQKIQETITVEGEAPMIDVKSTASAMTLTKEVIETLPRGRNFASLVTTMPSVNNEPWLAGISVDGASGAENQFYIDGMDTTNLYGGASGQNAAYEFVDEVQVKSSGYAAEFGGAMGGVINVITRSGGNEFHGELIGYYSGSKLTGKERDTLRLNPLDTTIAEYVNYQDLYGKDKIDRFEVGFNIGGYILKDKVWFFGAFLPVFRKQVRHVEWLSGDIPEGDYTRKNTNLNYSAKLTAQPFKDLRISASFLNNFFKWRGQLPGRNGAGDSSDVYADYGFDFPNWTATGSMDYVVGKNLLLSLRGGFFHTDTNNQQVTQSDPRWRFLNEAPAYYLTSTHHFDGTPLEIPSEYQRPYGWFNYGYADGYETKKQIRDRASINFDLNYYLTAGGEHSIKAGVQWVRIEEDVDNSYKNPYILFGWGSTFTWNNQTYSGTYGMYGVRGHVPEHDNIAFGTFANPNSTRWAIYLQDSWTIGYKFTINLGIRAEKEDIPSFSDLPEYADAPVTFNFKDKIAPRIGFVYDVFGDSSLKIYGSYGLFYDVMKLDLAVGSYGGFKWKSSYFTLDTYKWDEIGINGNYPGTYVTTLDWRIPSFDTTDTSLKPMSQQEIVLGAEKKIAENVAVTLRVVNKHLRYAIEDVGVLTPHGEEYFTCNPGYGWSLTEKNGGRFSNEYLDTPRAKREYWAVNLGIEKKFSNNWWGGASYTWSSLKGNYSGLASSDEYGRNNPNVERYFDLWHLAYDKELNKVDGPLATDRTHQIKVYGSYVFPFGLTIGMTANAWSGTPVSTQYNIWANGYMPYNRGDLGRTSFLFVTDLYVEYALKIGSNKLVVSLNVDNVLDTKTAQRIYSNPSTQNVPVSDNDLLNNSWEFSDYNLRPDPRFQKEMFFHAPITARLGLKFVF